MGQIYSGGDRLKGGGNTGAKVKKPRAREPGQIPRIRSSVIHPEHRGVRREVKKKNNRKLSWGQHMPVLECLTGRVGVHRWKVGSCWRCLPKELAPWSRRTLGGHQVLLQDETGLEEAASWGRKGQGRRELC